MQVDEGSERERASDNTAAQKRRDDMVSPTSWNGLPESTLEDSPGYTNPGKSCEVSPKTITRAGRDLYQFGIAVTVGRSLRVRH